MKVKALSVCVLGLALGGIAQASEVPMPRVADIYQQSFTAAWNQVSRGELPVYECTHVAGIASRMVKDEKTAADARQAYKACYVDSIVRFSDAYFTLHHHAEIADSGKPYGCDMYGRYLQGHVTSLETLAERFGYTTSELNGEISTRLNDLAQACEVEL